MSRKGDDPEDRDESAEQETKNKAAKHPAFRAQSPPARLSIYQVGSYTETPTIQVAAEAARRRNEK